MAEGSGSMSSTGGARLQGAPPDLVPARMINEVVYCERLLYLEWAQGEFADNYFTVDGRAVHRRADRPGGSLPPLPAAKEKPDAGAPPADDDPPYQARSVWLSSERLGITAKIDIVEGDEQGVVLPIEYKRGHPPKVEAGAHLPERVQLCAQVLLLREHGYRCDEAALYFAAARQRVRVLIDEELIAATLAAVERAKEVVTRAEMPPPLVDSPRCDGCSLIGICLPDETNLLRQMEAEAAQKQGKPLRRLHPARDDTLPVYVQEAGARIGLDGECLAIRPREGATVTARLVHTSQVCILGNVQISTQAMRELLERGIPVSFFSYGGWYYGRAIGHDSKNVELRVAQVRGASDPGLCLRLAKGFVVAKVKNCRTLLRRNHDEVDGALLTDLDRLARRADEATSLEELLGVEGTAARRYFGGFSGMLKTGDHPLTFDLEGRNRRPPRDPINALLSFTYSLLAKDFSIVLGAVGLDPLLGFYHQPRFGRPSLALDLMEEFRPLVADSTVVGAINNGSFSDGDFIRSAGAVALTGAARRRLIQAYERRMEQLVTQPVFGYRISYRRVLEVQARLLGRLLLGEIDDYPQFRTR